MPRHAFLLGSMLLLGACSTAVEHRTALPADVAQSGLSVGKVSASVAPSLGQELAPKLETAVRDELTKRKPGTKPVTLALNISKFEVASGTARFFAGAFAGSNKMDVTVQVLDEAGSKLGEFDVKREANPGGYGALYDQNEATVRSTAEGIVEALYGKP